MGIEGVLLIAVIVIIGYVKRINTRIDYLIKRIERR